MIGNNNVPFVRFAFLVHLLLWWSTAVNDLDAASISKEAENRAVAATVRIYVKQYSWQDYTFSGSGFFVKPHLIVSNFHVIEYEDTQTAWSYIAYSHSGSPRLNSVKSVKVFDVKQDLAVLEVSRSNVKPLELGRSETVERLNKVYVVGYPLGLECGITSGEINNPKQLYKEVEYIRFDAAVSPGNSGGPVLDLQGDVIGIATRGSWIIAQNINFAIPSNQLWSLLYRHGVRLTRKPKRDPDKGGSKRENEEKAKAEVERAKADTEKARAERAKAEARKVEAEARKVEAEAKKAEAEARKTEAERDKAEAEKAKAESKIAEAERAETEVAKPKKGKAEVTELEASITDRLQAATVHIYGRDRNGNEGRLGSGFFVREDQVATDFHVVDGSTLKGVKPVDQATQSADVLLAAKVLKTKKARHLAILEVETVDAHPLPIGDSDKIKKGGEIRVFSDPAVPKGKFSKGIISGSPPIDGVRFFQFDAPVSPGSSGGPIVNSSGEVVAVIAMKVPKLSETLKYAIPSIYLEKLLAGKGDARPPKPPSEPPDDGPDPEPIVTSVHEDLLKPGIDFYKAARFREAVEALQSALNWIDNPNERARAHLYLGFSKWGLAESKSSVSAEFREALRYDPSIGLPPEVGRSHPVFKPLLEQTRDESTGTLTITASPPETEIKIHGGEVQPKLPDGETVRLRLFKGNYAVEGILGHAHKVVPVLINPGDRQGISLTMSKTPVPEHEFEVTLDLFSTEKPKEVTVHYTIYDASGDEVNRGKKAMQLREHKTEMSIWVYHVKLPSAAQGGKIVYRIEADGKVIRDDPMQVEILEPPENAFIEANQTVPIKARVISNVEVREVRVVYDAPTTLAGTSPSQKLEKKSSSNTYIGKIPAARKHTDGATWYYITVANKSGDQARSATQAVRTKPPEIVVLEPPGAAVLPINKSIEVIAEVQTREPLTEIRVYYDFPRKELSEASPSSVLENKSSGTYMGKIPKQHNREAGYIWYFVSATTADGMELKSEDRVVEVKKLATGHRGVWASHSWSSYVQNSAPVNSDWARGDVVSLAYLHEGKGFQTIGARLDFPYENSVNTSAALQWGPALKDSHIAFALLAGVAGYRSSDAGSSRTRQSTEITPFVGSSLKFFPLDSAAIDLTGSIKLRSANGAGSRETDFTRTHLHHYEMGIRLYISPTLNLRAGYGRWRYGEYDNASVQVGLGTTF